MTRRPSKTPHPGANAEAPLGDLVAAYDRVALLLQGGGALGAYHVGVWEALEGAGVEPTWISGVSIGAINSAIIAGNPPERRLERLGRFWETVTRKSAADLLDPFDVFRSFENQWSGLAAMTMGQPGFFAPRVPSPWFRARGSEGATSFYDTGDLKRTLEELIDFDRLEAGPMRVSVGAVEVESGNFIWFDNRHPDPAKRTRIDVRHVMASGALPPALPAIDIDGRHYWDGGLVSNTPLEHLLEQEDDLSSLVFQVDLFPAQGAMPRDMAEVLARQKDITYSSRTRAGTTRFRQMFALRRQLLAALDRIPEELRTEADRATIRDLCKPGVVDILHVIYRLESWESANKDYEFSARSAREHRAAGRADMTATLARRDWFVPPKAEDAVATHDIHAEEP